MKKLKQVMTTTLVLSSLLLASCSNSNVNGTTVSNTDKIAVVETKYTENTDLSQDEINEVNKLVDNSDNKVMSDSFGVKSANEGKDVNIDLLLYNPKAAKRARFWGIKNANKLLYAGSSPTKRWFLNKKLGGLFASQAFKSQVLFWVERADVLRLKNVSLDDSFLLIMSGITSVPHLARFNNPFDQAAITVQLSLLAFQYGMKIPKFDDVKSWTNEATMTAPVLY
ncbi:MAG: DUF4332 domain-containing protein [Candidatus Sericytochromatia bacterium]|nr:DUF4332 domain-containing protein [Candidatus Sericytochromatia bacterium]